MSNNGKKKLNKSAIIIIAIIVFFLLYFLSFKLARGYLVKHGSNDTTNVMNVENDGEKTEVQKEIEMKKTQENKKGALERFKESKKMYISDEEVKNIKVEGETLESFKRSMSNFVVVRSVGEEFHPDNKGKTNNDVRFETDFNYFQVTAGNKKEYYKIPVSDKEDFRNMYRRMIYTSVDFITNGDKIGEMKLYHKNEEKKVWPWKKKDLIHKILYKREVGKIQPEKEFSKSKQNYTIKIKKSGVELSIQTMGKDFIKVHCGDNIAYYEVYTDLYDYLSKDVFKK